MFGDKPLKCFSRNEASQASELCQQGGNVLDFWSFYTLPDNGDRIWSVVTVAKCSWINSVSYIVNNASFVWKVRHYTCYKKSLCGYRHDHLKLLFCTH